MFVSSGRRRYPHEEETPEWFTGGPSSQNETIELRGFERQKQEKRRRRHQEEEEEEGEEYGGDDSHQDSVNEAGDAKENTNGQCCVYY